MITHGPCAIHESTVAGLDVVVWQFSTILEGVRIGDGCVIGSGVFIGRGAVLGTGVRIQDKAHITNGMIIGDGVFVGPGVLSTDDKYPVVGNRDYESTPPTILDGASIGAGAILLPGVRIGRGAMIGAGAVVTSDVEDNARVVGVPARGIRG